MIIYDKSFYFLMFLDERPSLTMYPPPPVRGGKRGDIHRLGILIWTLFQVLFFDHLTQ